MEQINERKSATKHKLTSQINQYVDGLFTLVLDELAALAADESGVTLDALDKLKRQILEQAEVRQKSMLATVHSGPLWGR